MNVKVNKIISVVEMVDLKQLLMAAHKGKYWGHLLHSLLPTLSPAPKGRKKRKGVYSSSEVVAVVAAGR